MTRLLKVVSGTVVTNLDGCVNQAFMHSCFCLQQDCCVFTAPAPLERCRTLHHITPVLKSSHLLPVCQTSSLKSHYLSVKHWMVLGLNTLVQCNARTPQEEAYSVFLGPQTNKQTNRMKQRLITTILFTIIWIQPTFYTILPSSCYNIFLSDYSVCFVSIVKHCERPRVWMVL